MSMCVYSCVHEHVCPCVHACIHVCDTNVYSLHCVLGNVLIANIKYCLYYYNLSSRTQLY